MKEKFRKKIAPIFKCDISSSDLCDDDPSTVRDSFC